MIAYPARIIPTDEGLVLVRFPDVPEAAATGATETEALTIASQVLEAVLRSYRAEGRPLPRPSDICAAPLVEVAGFDISDFVHVEQSGRG